MTVVRRDLLLGGVGFGAAALIPESIMAARQARLPEEAQNFPMPLPVRTLPDRLPVKDPSRILLDRGWLFHEGDIETPTPKGHNATYLRAKAGRAGGAAAIDYDDSDWSAVTLPHDWASFQAFDANANPSQGYRVRGIGWYRRMLRIDPADRGKTLELQFDGIATNATIWVNGSVVAHNWSGYNSVYVDLTPFARFGDELNSIAIRVDAAAMEGWWYEGAGLYRHVWLVRRAPVAILTDGIHCDPRPESNAAWIIPVTVALANIERTDTTVNLELLLLDPDGQTITTHRQRVTITTLATTDIMTTLRAVDPRRWSIDTPVLYTLHARVWRDGESSDERYVPIGFRTIRFDADQGFFLNDKPVKLKGVCIHQDHAGVGVAVPDALLEWRLSRLKDMGCNAIRCSHNAPAAELLDLCDRMGILVMDENRNFNPSPDYLKQLEWLVRRDRNHPCVILWSVFNEEPMQGTEAGVEMVRRMVAAVHRLDDSRPVTAAMNGSFFDPVNVSSVVDVMGFNYYIGDYDRFHALNPAKPITSSEDTSAFETRGAFASDRAQQILSSYDTEFADWGESHRKTWKAIVERPFVAGTFVWTGFDYHGEPTPFEWPSQSSFFGAMDLCGFPKTAFDIHRAHWIDDRPVVSITPHWTWPGREGQSIKVMIMSNAERIRLMLNGRLLGEQAVDRIMGNEWNLPYAPGRLEAMALQNDRIVAHAMHETAGPPVALRLTPARTLMAGDGEDAQPITIDAIDSKGRHVPTANLPTKFTVQGGLILGVGNGDPNSHEPEKGETRMLFNGLAQIIIQAGTGRGKILVKANASGLRPATLSIDRLMVEPRDQVPLSPSGAAVSDWRRSPAFSERPDPAITPTDGDNNSWSFLRAGTPTPVEPVKTWRIYRATPQLRKQIASQGGIIAFRSIAGRAELWIDGRQMATKTAPEPGPLNATIAAGQSTLQIALLVEAPPGAPSGLLDQIWIENRSTDARKDDR